MAALTGRPSLTHPPASLHLRPTARPRTFHAFLRRASMASTAAASTSSPTTTASPCTILLPSLLSASIDLARLAGVAIKDIFHSGQLGAIDKAQLSPHPPPSSSTPASSSLPSSSPSPSASSLTDPQTLADLAAQRLIVSSLSHAFPGLHIIGEEGELVTSPSDVHSPSLTLLDSPPSTSPAFPPHLSSPLPLSSVAVWVDPLDGTKEFTLGYTDSVTVLIGITVQGRAVAGVIGQPFTGHVVWGCEGVGVRGLQPHAVQNFHVEEAAARQTATPPRPLPATAPTSRVVATTRSHFTPLLSSLLSSLHPTSIIRSGGAGSKTLLLLSGQADVYFFPSPGLKYWDVVACEALVRAAGGRATDAWGKERRWEEGEGSARQYRVDGGLIATLHHHDFYTLPASVDIHSKA